MRATASHPARSEPHSDAIDPGTHTSSSRDSLRDDLISGSPLLSRGNSREPLMWHVRPLIRDPPPKAKCWCS